MVDQAVCVLSRLPSHVVFVHHVQTETVRPPGTVTPWTNRPGSYRPLGLADHGLARRAVHRELPVHCAGHQRAHQVRDQFDGCEAAWRKAFLKECREVFSIL